MKRAATLRPLSIIITCGLAATGTAGGCRYGGEPPAPGVFTLRQTPASTPAQSSDLGTNDNGHRDEAPPEGFVPLLSGRTLAGWKGLVEPEKGPPARAKLAPLQLAAAQAAADATMRAHWSFDASANDASGDVLFFDGSPHGASLCTARDYTDFELMLDWMIPPGGKGDSGIYLRGSPQVQIWESVVGSGGLYNNLKHENNPLEKADNPAGSWNRFFIRMRGERVWVWLNGILVTNATVMENYWERDKPIYPSGQIELQSHGGPLWFCNIWIREIDDE